MALLDLLHLWSRSRDVGLSAATVNHGLRPEAATEAANVAAFCATRSIPHETLHWDGLTAVGNLQDQARQARYRLLSEWGMAQGVDRVALGHTQDDQAETFLMRLAREAGVDGLSGMRAGFRRHGLHWVRPLLDVSRERLKAYLVRQGIEWSNDPSNDDERYERVKARKVLASLSPLGIDAGTLRRVAFQMEDARVALQKMTCDLARVAVTEDRGDLVVNLRVVNGQTFEIGRRLLVSALCYVSGSHYPARRQSVERLILFAKEKRQTLTGCILDNKGDRLRVMRELSAVRTLSTPTTALWDNRWHLSGPHDPALEIRALGETGIRQCPDWRATGMQRHSLLASPAIWRGGTLIAAPLAAKPEGWTARIATDFHASLVSH